MKRRLFIRHIIFWGVVFFVEVSRARFSFEGYNLAEFWKDFMETLCNLPVIMFASYFTVYYLIPEYLRKRRWARFLVLFFLSLLAAVFLMRVVLHYLVFPVWYPSFAARNPGFFQFNFFQYVFYIYSVVLFMALLKMVQDFTETVRDKEILEQQNLKSEMALLRSQVNPHFLFNTLNNIHTLVKSDPDRTAESIIRLSEIMRYMTSEASQVRVPLTEEIRYLQNYIGLLSLRQDDSNFIRLDCTGNLAQKTIPPMLFIPFVENAYKHGKKEVQSPGITVGIEASDAQIIFRVTNFLKTISHGPQERGTGIGIQNVTRRLELLYPECHSLRYWRDNLKYYVEMTLEDHG